MNNVIETIKNATKKSQEEEIVIFNAALSLSIHAILLELTNHFYASLLIILLTIITSIYITIIDDLNNNKSLNMLDLLKCSFVGTIFGVLVGCFLYSVPLLLIGFQPLKKTKLKILNPKYLLTKPILTQKTLKIEENQKNN